MGLKTMEYIGEPLTFERQLAVSNVLASISEGTYHIKNRKIGFTSGGTYEPLVGDIIVDGTSGAVGVLTKIVKDTGAWASVGNAAGTFYFINMVGSFTATATTLNLIKAADGAGVSDAATSVAASEGIADEKVRQEREAIAMLVEVLTYAINYTTDGTAPTTDANTTIPGRGINAVANTNFILEDIQSIKNFKWTNAVAGQNAQVRFQGFFD